MGVVGACSLTNLQLTWQCLYFTKPVHLTQEKRQQPPRMERSNILHLAFFMILLLVLTPMTESQLLPLPPATSRPLCVSQFALVNSACTALPFYPDHPPPPPSPPPPLPSHNESEHRHRHRHKHGHRHVHGHRHGWHGLRGTPVEQDCCRWLKSMDSECVCDLLVYLPPFLSRPVHQYNVVVDDSCNVTFQCASRLRT
ncbi:unnamed protein product [Ilex paraguariensis]|uniref:Bifunctional inhibitor/plant lipid transfer protein/seed storage helical domain-containing protein n=1 Tax=Ilex paraguariensis TaxID=185542 RepID=A0ABC8U2G5_9AQUA